MWWWGNWTNWKFAVGKQNISVGHYEKIKKWLLFCKYRSYGKMSNYQPQQSLGLWFSECRLKWNISVSHYEKIEKWLPFHKYWSYGKISNYWPPKVWVSHFLSFDGNRISVSAIMKKSKNGCHFVHINHTENFKLPIPPMFGSSGFLSVDWNGISVLAIMKKLKNGCHFVNIDCMEKFQITDHPQVWVSHYLSFNRNGTSVSTIIKNWKMATIL